LIDPSEAKIDYFNYGTTKVNKPLMTQRFSNSLERSVSKTLTKILGKPKSHNLIHNKPQKSIQEDTQVEEIKINDKKEESGILPPKTKYSPIHTLVLDLDETLIHYVVNKEEGNEDTNENYYLVRPHTVNFLK